MALAAFARFDIGSPVMGKNHLLAVWVAAQEMVVEGWQDDCPKLFEEGIVLVGVDELMEFDSDAGEAGGFPLDEGVEDGLPLGMFKLEKAGCGVLGDEVEGLQNSNPHLLLGQFWELVFELTKGLGIGLGLGIELVAVSIFACTVLPNTIGEGLKTMNVWGIVVSLVGDTYQRSAAPSSKVVIPKVLECGLMVDQSLMGNRWGPNVGHEVSVVVLVESLE